MVHVKYKTENAHKRIPRLIQATVEGFPVGNLEAALDELRCVTVEYLDIARMLEDKATEVSEESKQRALYDAVFVLRNACREFTRLRKRVLKSLKSNNVMAEMLIEEMAILKAEFEEIGKALTELLRMRWWTW